MCLQAEIDGKRLISDIIKNISRPIAFDAVMRLRTSAGVRATDFYGHFFMTNTTDVELASVGKFCFIFLYRHSINSVFFALQIVTNQLPLKLNMTTNYRLRRMFIYKSHYCTPLAAANGVYVF